MEKFSAQGLEPKEFTYTIREPQTIFDLIRRCQGFFKSNILYVLNSSMLHCDELVLNSKKYSDLCRAKQRAISERSSSMPNELFVFEKDEESDMLLEPSSSPMLMAEETPEPYYFDLFGLVIALFWFLVLFVTVSLTIYNICFRTYPTRTDSSVGSGDNR